MTAGYAILVIKPLAPLGKVHQSHRISSLVSRYDQEELLISLLNHFFAFTASMPVCKHPLQNLVLSVSI